ncbi:MAG: SUF system NifU family Fe-S cluster assembly protein [bacterium]
MALDALYLEKILEHYKRPRNMERPATWDGRARSANPACGDDLSVYLTLEGDRIAGIRFDGSGCAISLSSASMMTEALWGKSLEEAERFRDSFLALMAEGTASGGADLGDLEVLQGVRTYPARIRCATLAWDALTDALEEAVDAKKG